MATMPDPSYLMRMKVTGTTVKVALSNVTARSSAVSGGVSRVISDQNCFIKQGGSGVNATTNDYYLPANTPWDIYVDDADATSTFLAGIMSSGTGNLYIMPLLP